MKQINIQVPDETYSKIIKKVSEKQIETGKLYRISTFILELINSLIEEQTKTIDKK